MMQVGEVLICIKYHEQYMNVNVPGKKYIIKNISDHDNVYVSSDILLDVINGCPITKEGGSTKPYSLTKYPDKTKPYSELYISEYFTKISDIRERKINQILSI